MLVPISKGRSREYKVVDILKSKTLNAFGITIMLIEFKGGEVAIWHNSIMYLVINE